MPRTRPIALAVAAAVVALFTAPGAEARGAADAPVAAPWFVSSARIATGRLDAVGVRRLEARRWRTLRAAAGPTIRVSPAYADSDAVAERWAAFFASLVHGSELQLLNAYVAPLDEVRTLCGGSDVLGCYWANRMVIPDQVSSGIAVTSIATHEYGHHIAFNRLNSPWIAVDWGTKRWATYEHVCERAARGTAYPGDEDFNYPLNPGEAFAETYRVLNESTAGLPLTWPIVDPSFRPDAAALDAARRDVLDPWPEASATTRRVQFAKAARSWTTQMATPLDGRISVQVSPGSDDVTLSIAGAGAPLARGSWTSTGAKALDYTVCGQRTFVLRVTRHSPARRFTVRLSVP
jgi:hypothetical protein